MRALYNLGLKLYFWGIWIAAFFNPKARQWIKGRKDWQVRLKQQVGQLPKDQKTIWIHCASLGEFEQGRPLMEQIKSQHPKVAILLSFFSPSGYEIRKDYAFADVVCYLPIDSSKNAHDFLTIIQPTQAIFVKYEFWYHFLFYLKAKNIPTYLISAIFRKDQVFFKSYGRFFRQLLSYFDHLFVQNETSAELLKRIGVENYSVTGDTRVDRVLQIAAQEKKISEVESFVGSHKILIVGSSWPPDEQLLFFLINHHLPTDWKVIIAPHQIDEGHLQKIEKGLQVSFIRFSKATESSLKESVVLLIDNIGMLSTLYRYGHLAYIGGGFGAGIHNTLEPIAFGLPVLFGPKYQKFEEAIQLVRTGGGICIHDQDALLTAFNNLLADEVYQQASEAAQSYIRQNKGATEKIFNGLSF